MASHLRRSALHVKRRVLAAPRFLTLSAVDGPSYPPLVSSTLSEYFTKVILEKHRTQPALICRKERSDIHGGSIHNLGISSHLAWDFKEFDRHIAALSWGLLRIGVKRGDRVGVIMGNNSAYATLQWACARVGAILVTLNPAYRLNELTNALKLSGASHLFLVPQIRSSSYLSLLSEAFPALRSCSQGSIQEPALPELRNLIVFDDKGNAQNEIDRLGLGSAIDWREIMVWRPTSLSHSLLDEVSTSVQKDDIANLQFTSGTTGSPKAVSLTHSNLLNNALSIARCMRLTSMDILCNVPPLFHCFDEYSGCLVLGNLAAWSQGTCIVYPSEIYDPEAIVDAVVKDRCTALHGVPTHFLGVLAEVDKRQRAGGKLDLTRLRTGIAAGSPIPIDLMRRLITKLNLVDLTNAYGMTETSPVSFQTTPDDPILKRVETVGKVQPHVKAKIIDGDGNIVPVGVPGEICIAGYLLQKGYWQDEEHTRVAMREDEATGTVWMHTGDEGILDPEGYLRIISRIKDIIIRGGENLFPVQIENALTAHSAVEEAAAVSVPDEKFGDVVGAWIVRQPGQYISAQEVRLAISDNMSAQNAPAWVWFVGDDGMPKELPKTASGKVMKHVLRDWGKELAQKGVGRTT